MRLAWLILFLSLFANANEMVVHTIGDGQSRTMAKLIFPDAAVLPSPGANGAFVWKRLENNYTDVALQVPLVAHYFALTSEKEDPSKQYELLATFAAIRQVLLARPDLVVNNLADVKKLNRPVSVAWIGNSCEAVVKKAFAPYGIDFVYVSYKMIGEAMNAFAGGHVDFICPAGTSLRQALKNKMGTEVFDFKDYYGTQHIVLFVNRGMPEITKQNIIQQITRKLTEEDFSAAENAGFVWSINTGASAKMIFDRERQAWRNIVN